MDNLKPGTFSKHRRFGRSQISRTIWHGLNMPMDFSDRTIWHEPDMLTGILDRTKYQGPFGTDQMSLWIFLARTKCLLAECPHSIKLSLSPLCRFSDLWIQKVSVVHCWQITPGYWMTSQAQRTRYCHAAQLQCIFHPELHALDFGFAAGPQSQALLEEVTPGILPLQSGVPYLCGYHLFTLVHDLLTHTGGVRSTGFLYPYFSFPFHFILLYAVFGKPEPPVSFLEQEQK